MSSNTNAIDVLNALIPPPAGIAPLGYTATNLSDEKPTIATPCAAYAHMYTRWSLIEDLLGGTMAMRLVGRKWLPQEPLEKESTYNLRLSRSFLYPGLENNLDKLSARPFLQPVKLEGSPLPEALKDMEDNVDRTGSNLTLFAAHVFRDGVAYGKSHILIDYPSVDPSISLADRRTQKIRPTFVHIPATSLIGWKYETTPEGFEELTEIRFRSCRSEYSAQNEWQEKEVNLIRRYTKDKWEVWREEEQETTTGGILGSISSSSKKWVLDSEGTHTLGEVPVVTYYTHRTGFMTAKPPLENLAWLNLAHWQSSSDQRNILRFARVGILFAKGISQEQQESGFAVGPSTMLSVSATDADMKYVEHNGNAIEAGRNDLKDLEEQMEVLGFQPLMQKAGGAGATGKALDEIKGQTVVENWIESLEAAMIAAYGIAAKWEKVELPKDFNINIYCDIGLTPRTRDDILALLEMSGMGKIGDEDLVRELMRRGLLTDTTNIKQFINQARRDYNAKLTREANTSGGNNLNSGGLSPRIAGQFGGTGVGVRDPKTSANNGGRSRNRNRNKDNLTGNVQDAGITGARS